jgi:hypothetical protein
MSRLFELKSHSYEGDVSTIIDLEKICWVQIEKKPRQHYPHIMVRFLGGQEWHDLMMEPSAYQLVEAYRAYLSGQGPKKTAPGRIPGGFQEQEARSRLATVLSGSAN